MTGSILFGEHLPGSRKAKNWIELYNGEDKVQDCPFPCAGQKSLIVLPGDGARKKETIDNCCSHIEEMLIRGGLTQKQMPRIYGLAYTSDDALQTPQEIHRYQLTAHLKQDALHAEYMPGETKNVDYFQPFIDRYILPLIMNENGKPRSLSEIQKNLEDITFVSYCHGGFISYHVEKALYDGLALFYPDQAKQLMTHLRMVHFASKRPRLLNSSAKHLDIISLNDKTYADNKFLAYDSLYNQLHRIKLSAPSTLILLSPNQQILLLQKLACDDDHDVFLQTFSQYKKTPFPQNAEIISFVQQVLCHFIQHPEDKNDLSLQLKQLNPTFFEKNTAADNAFLIAEQEREKIRRASLSLVSDWGANLGKNTKHVFSNNAYDDYYDFVPDPNPVMRQRDDKGRLLYNELKSRYLVNGDSLSLINYIQNTHPANLPPSERGKLAVLTAQKGDWELFQLLGGEKKNLFFATPDQIEKIIVSVPAEQLFHLVPFFNNSVINNQLIVKPELLLRLFRKIKRIQNKKHKMQVENCLSQKLELNINTRNFFFQQTTLKEKRFLKILLIKSRRKKLQELLEAKKERDEMAPDLSVKDVLYAHAFKFTFDQYRQFKKEKEKTPDLTPAAFKNKLPQK